MESKKIDQDFRSFDWDDTALIKAYDKGMKLKGKSTTKSRRETRNKASKENSKYEDKWFVGNYCRAVYPADGLYYEAKIRSVDDNYCTIEYLGYGDKEEVDLKTLKESFGKNSRKKQIRSVKEGRSGYYSISETCGDTTDVPSESHDSCVAKKKLHESQVTNPYDYSAAEHTFHVPHHTAPYYAPPAVPNSMPFLPAPPAPPMPQCPSLANNPSLTAMLVSWYMAGYYTGLHQVQKGPQCSQRCCGHSNQCCHH